MSISKKNEVVGVLDLGSSKVCCVISERVAGLQDGAGEGLEDFRLLGFGHHRSRGVKSGVIVDLDAAEEAVRAAVADAEHDAGVKIENVYVGVSCGRLKSLNFRAEASLDRGVVGVDDLTNLWDGAREYAGRGGRTIVSLNEVGYLLDGCESGRDLRGLAGRRLAADVHAVTSDSPPLHNVQALVKRCFLEVSDFLPSAFASGLAATTVEEREAGVTCIDIGGGVTTTAIFAAGRFLHTGVIPFGGGHISLDIARDLAISFEEAERIKTLHGTVLRAASDETELIGYNSVWAGQVIRKQISRSHVRQIIEHRLCLLLEMVAEQLSQGQITMSGGQRIVITGGGSQLLGFAEFAANTLERPVRVGAPQIRGRGADLLDRPGFSSVIGMLPASQAANHLISSQFCAEGGLDGSFGRVGRWLRESF